MPTKFKNPMPVTVAEAGKAKARKRARRKKPEPITPVVQSLPDGWLGNCFAGPRTLIELRKAGNAGDYDRIANIILADQHLQKATFAEVLEPWPQLSVSELSYAMGRELNRLEAGRYTGAKMLEEWSPVKKESEPPAPAPAGSAPEGCVDLASVTPAPPGDSVWTSKEVNRKLAEAIMSTPSVMEAFVKDVVKAKSEFIDSLFKPDAAKADTEPMPEEWAKKHIAGCVKLAQSDWPNRPEDRKIMLGPSDRAGENLGAQAMAAMGVPSSPFNDMPSQLCTPEPSPKRANIHAWLEDLGSVIAGLHQEIESLEAKLQPVLVLEDYSPPKNLTPMNGDCNLSTVLSIRIAALWDAQRRLAELRGRVAL